ncbi:MAG: YqjK-like family protein [Sulfuricella sp.]|nr:YqjK-like family protein [Sulfuricella sp.]
MKNRTLEELALYRTALTARAATQRTQLSQAVIPLRGGLALADQGLAAARHIARHPMLLVGAMAVAAAFRPKRVAGWLSRGWEIWRVVRAVKQSLSGS